MYYEGDNLVLEKTDKSPIDTPSASPNPDNKENHKAESSTLKASVKNLRVPYGKYEIYAVANVDKSVLYDSEGEPTGLLQDVKQLKEYKIKWNPDNIASNDQMFGYFSTKDESSGFDGEKIIINQKTTSLHAWIKRAASKVTVAFDGSKLKENIWIFLRSVEIKDIPNECYLGADNPVSPKDMEDGDKGTKIDFSEKNQTIVYGGESTNYEAETWGAFIAKGHPIFGVDSAAAVNSQLTVAQRLAAQHSETATALYFFENLQGKGINGTESDKRQQVKDGQEENPDKPTYPDGINPDNAAWKDAKRYGTYIEVKAYYYSNNPGDPGQGEIIYRFMLGKDTHLDYNAQRNHHYKLTLCFNGYANDVDWHIEYEKEDRPINNPNPYYISYLYNHSMMLPLHINLNEYINDPSIDYTKVKVTEINANITSNGWGPVKAKDGAYANSIPGYFQVPGFNEFKLYWAQQDKPEEYPFNGFLSLRATKDLVVFPALGNIDNNPLTMTGGQSNQYYYDKENRGNVSYKESDIEAGSAKKTIDEALENALPYVGSSTNYDGENLLDINIPLWTRAKQLIKETGYTGNNPFVAYQRESKLKVSVKLQDDAGHSWTVTTGYKNNKGEMLEEEISIRQVRRIVNPKGVYRSGNKKDPFHVKLMTLPSEEDTEFKPLQSEGPWRAYVIRDTKRSSSTDWSKGVIKLTGAHGTTTGTRTLTDDNGVTETYQTIEGSTSSYMDFTINFNGTTTSSEYAVIRVEYHNYTCIHLIFVRQGMDADELISGGAKWMTCNNISKDQVTSSPLDEGSMFKQGNWDYPIAASNNKNIKTPWVNVKPEDFYNNIDEDPKFDIVGKNDRQYAWSEFNSSPAFSNPTGMRVASGADYLALYSDPDIKQGYGVLYGDESSETLTNLEDVYGYSSGMTNRGMRGCFVYNYRTGKNLFFPIGASGYGHRLDQIKDTDPATKTVITKKGVLRYNCSAGRWGYFPGDGKWTGGKYKNGGVNLAPLFFDVFRRPGAIYWFNTGASIPYPAPETTTGGLAWDFNYFTFDFHSIGGGDVANGKDAAFVRCIKTN